jgi:MFS family permease
MGLRTVYGIAAGLFMISTSLILLLHPQAPTPVPAGGRYRVLLGNRAFAGFLALVFVSMFGLYLSWPLTPNYLQNVRSVSISEIGVLGSLNALGVVALNLTIGRLTPWAGFLLAQVLVGASVSAFWLATSMPWFALAYFLAGAFRTARSMVTAHIEGLVRHAELGLAFGLAETTAGLVQIVGAPMAGYLYRLEPVLPFPAALAVIAVSLILTARFAPRRPSPLAEAAAGGIDPRRE